MQTIETGTTTDGTQTWEQRTIPMMSGANADVPNGFSVRIITYSDGSMFVAVDAPGVPEVMCAEVPAPTD